ncbi:hypothetical protein ACU4GR_15785 [Methylobacterium oryzae CBMB20]
MPARIPRAARSRPLSRSISLALLVLFGVAAAGAPCRAQTKPGEIKGVDAMGDKSRSAQDGWSQAPCPGAIGRQGRAGSRRPRDRENADRPVPQAIRAGHPRRSRRHR